jgi:hypothetical protein
MRNNGENHVEDAELKYSYTTKKYSLDFLRFNVVVLLNLYLEYY